MKYDYHALLTIHDLPSMSKEQITNLVGWLRNNAAQIAKEKDLKVYSKRFRARLMK